MAMKIEKVLSCICVVVILMSVVPGTVFAVDGGTTNVSGKYNSSWGSKSNLAPDTIYTVSVGANATDLAGNNLQSPYSRQFTTISSEPTMDIQAEIRSIWSSDTISPIALFGQNANLGHVVQADLDADSFTDSLPNYDDRCLGDKNYDKSVISRFREGEGKVRIVLDITGGTGFKPGSEGYIKIVNPEYKITKIFDQSDYIGVQPPTMVNGVPVIATDHSGFGVVIDMEEGCVSWQGRGSCPNCGCRENYFRMEFLVEKASNPADALNIDVWTDKSEYNIGETVTIYYQTNTACTAKLTVTKPDGTQVVVGGPNDIPVCTRSKSAAAGYPTGTRTVTFEAWTSDESKIATCYFDVVEEQNSGTLTVTIYPSEVQSNARWKLTSGPDTNWHSSGDTVSNIPVGSYTIQYKDVSGWTKPSDKGVTITEGTNYKSGTYTKEAGSLTVTIYPSDVPSEAHWKLTTGPDTNWHSSGDTVSNIPIGSYTIQFKDVSGWTKPSDKGVTITEGSNSQSGTYTPEEAKGDMSLLWKNETADYVLSVSVSENGEYVAFGSKDTYVYYFNKFGDLIWKYKTNGAVNSVSTSNDGDYVIAGSDDYHIYYFDKGGFLWKIEVDERITTTDISSDGRYAIAGSWNKCVYFFDHQDPNKLLWKRVLEGVCDVSISDDGRYIAIGGSDVYLLDKYNTTIWEKDISGGVVDISGDGNYVIVGADGYTTYVYHKSGKLEWKDSYDDVHDDHGYRDVISIGSVSLSTDGSYSVVGTYGFDLTIRSFDKTGNVVWRIKNDTYAVDISGDGHYIAAGVSSSEMGESVLYIDNFDDGNIIYDYSLEDHVWVMDLSKDGKYFAAAAKNTVYFFGTPSGNPEPNITAQIYSNGWKPLESFSIYPQAKRDIKFTLENRGWGSNLGYIDISVSNGLDIVSWEDDSSGYMNYDNLGPNSNNPIGEATYSDGSRRVPQFELLSGYKQFGCGEKNTVTVTVKATGEGEQWIKYRASMESSDGYVRDPSSGDKDQQGWHAHNITVTVDGIQPDVVIPIEDEYADWISIGDLNGDDLNDIVMENGDVFYQQMDNSFLLDNLGFEGICVCAGKINNDDLNDIVMTSHFSEPPTNYGLIRIYYQQNDNTFKDVPDLEIETGYWAKYCQIDDINNDGSNDILVGLGIIGSTGETSTKIYYQKEDGSFGSTPDVNAPWLSGIVSLSDFNQDGLKDLVGESASTWGAVVYFQGPDHTFDSTYDERMTHLPFGVDTLFKGMGDVDGNGLDDIIYNNWQYPDQSVAYRQFSDHNFIASDTQYVTGRDVNSIDVGDLNNDGQNDVAIFYDDHTFKGPGFIGIYYQKYVMDVEILSPTNDFSVLKDSNVPIEVKVTYEGEPIMGASLVRASFSNGDSDVILTGGVKNGIYTGTWTPTNTIGGQVETPVEITIEASHGTLSKGYAKVKGVIEDGNIIKVEILSPDADFQVLEGSNVPIKVRLTNKGVPITGANLVRASFSNGDTDVILTGGVNGIYTGSWTPTNTNEGQDETPVEITVEATHATLNEGHANVAGVISNEYMYVGEIRKRLIENPDDIVNKHVKVHAFVYSKITFSKVTNIFRNLIDKVSKRFPGQINSLIDVLLKIEGEVLTFYIIAGDLPGENDYVADEYPISFIVTRFPVPIGDIDVGSIVEINGEVTGREENVIRYYLAPDWPGGIKYVEPNSLFIRLPKLYDDLEASKRIGEKVSTMGDIPDWYPTNSGYYFAHIYCRGDDGKRRHIPIAFHKSKMPDTYGLALITGTIVDDKEYPSKPPYILVDSIEIKIKSNKKPPDTVSASTDCPVHLHAYDTQGRHVGVNATGGVDFEIPDAYHSGIDSDAEEIIILNQSEGIRFSVVAIDRGVFNLTITQSTDMTLKEIFYQNVPISETTVATVDVSQENPTYTMEIDDEGDGTTDETKEPDFIETIGQDLYVFDTHKSKNPYPSIPGTHTGTITPNQDVNVSKLYTYPCAGTGGHIEYVRISGNNLDESASWSSYAEDGHTITFDSSFTPPLPPSPPSEGVVTDTITFDSPFTLESGKTYNYVIETGSYPQIHHTDNLSTPAGFITCSEFRDVNGKRYSDWIPAIRLT